MQSNEKKAFSLIARVASFRHAFRGVWIFVTMAHNAWVELLYAGLVIILGIRFSISEGEWLALVLSLGVLLMAEAFNTAIEVDMNLTSPNFHPFARDTKDIAAGAVLIAVLMALIVFGIIFLPKIIMLFS